MKKYSEIIKLDAEVLEQDLKAAVAEMHSLKLEHKIKGLQNPRHISHLRKEIAMMKTEQTKRSSTKA